MAEPTRPSETPQQAEGTRPNDDTIIHRFIWNWAKGCGVDPSEGNGDSDNASRLDDIVSRLHDDGDIETIAMLREALAEAKRETTEARIAARDEDPWVWSDDDDINETVEGFGHMMVVRITGGHLRALIRESKRERDEARRELLSTLDTMIQPPKWRSARELAAKRGWSYLYMTTEREGLGPEDMENDR